MISRIRMEAQPDQEILNISMEHEALSIKGISFLVEVGVCSWSTFNVAFLYPHKPMDSFLTESSLDYEKTSGIDRKQTTSGSHTFQVFCDKY